MHEWGWIVFFIGLNKELFILNFYIFLEIEVNQFTKRF